MGLDNGIILETNKPIRYFPWFADFELIKEESTAEKYVYELAYWRKCWGLRECIFQITDTPIDSDQYEYNFQKEEIKQVIKLLLEVNNKEDWQDMSNIWDYEDDNVGKMLFFQIGTLMWAYEWMNKRPQDIIRCYFYDSY